MRFLACDRDGKGEVRRYCCRRNVQEVDELVAVCDDLGANRSEIVEAIFTAFVHSKSNHAKQVQDIIIRKRKALYNFLYVPCTECTLF